MILKVRPASVEMKITVATTQLFTLDREDLKSRSPSFPSRLCVHHSDDAVICCEFRRSCSDRGRGDIGVFHDALLCNPKRSSFFLEHYDIKFRRDTLLFNSGRSRIIARHSSYLSIRDKKIQLHQNTLPARRQFPTYSSTVLSLTSDSRRNDKHLRHHRFLLRISSRTASICTTTRC